MLKRLVLMSVVGAALLSCGSGRLQWFSDCVCCGIPPNPDAGPGSCPTEQAGDACVVAGQTCSVSADPCMPGLICGTSQPICSSEACP
jgi:hypothetical protein